VKEVGGACRKNGRYEKVYRINLMVRDRLEDLPEQGGKVWTRFI